MSKYVKNVMNGYDLTGLILYGLCFVSKGEICYESPAVKFLII